MTALVLLLLAGPIEESRALQRARGYEAALAHLEANLTSWKVADHYVRVCAWAGEEDRGLRALTSAPLPRAQADWARSELLALALRYDEAAEVGRQAGRPADWVRWAEARAAQRARLLARGRRAGIMGALAFAAFAAAGAAAFRSGRPRATS
jgi:hypothetical protein